MTASTLKPGEILRDALQRVGPVFVPVAVLALPGVLLPVLIPNMTMAAVVNVLYAILVAPVLGGAMIILIHRCLAGQTTDIGAALAMAWRRAVPLVLSALLLFIILVPAFALLVIPGIYLAVRLFSTQYAVVLERKSPIDALSASWELTRGHWWPIFGTILVITLAFVMPLIIVSAILGAVLPWGDAIGSLLGVVVTPPLVMAFLMVYKVLKGEAALDSDGANPASA